jgi:3-hydroxyacyl-[acyl-carrier-protein] dehydratase
MDESPSAQPKTLESADILRIMTLLPHRYPFLLVDRIVEMDGDRSCIGIKNVSANEPQFAGHFPTQPIMPGVLLIEGMAQTAGALCVASRGTNSPRLVYFLTIDKAKFRRPVVPGDVIEYHMVKIRSRGSMWWFRGEAKVGDAVAAEAEVSAMLIDK